ncbi:MAG TPA: hypothetical protein VGM34_02600 [Chlamydiales bacterium]
MSNQFEVFLLKKTKIDFDKKKKIFRLTMPVSSGNASTSVLTYVDKRKGIFFKPHQTSFHLHSSNQVELVQEIPFHLGVGKTFRSQLVEFWLLGKRCYQMLHEMALEENLDYLKNL